MKRNYNSPKLVSIESVCLQEEFICIDGVKIGKYIERDGIAYLQIADKNPHRSDKRGTRLVEISIDDLGRIRFCREDVL